MWNIVDDTAEFEIWKPHGIDPQMAQAYPPMQAHSISCFMRMCGLAEILNEVLVHLYDPHRQRPEEQVQYFVEELASKLHGWHSELPEFLKLSAVDLPLMCPPSHIAVLK